MKPISRSLLILVTIAGLLGAARAEDPLLRPGHPDRYVVKKGDTLWDIAGRFLHEPWRWPEIWYANPEIRNPHLIYPGDELTLVWIDGRPRLTVGRRGPLKLSPRVRSRPIEQAVPAIPVDHIAPYLTRPYVMEAGELESLPYVVAFADEHIVAGAGQRVYVRGLDEDGADQYDIVRPGKAYRDAETGEVLGYEALYAGSGKLLTPGDPATVAVHRTRREILTGDRLLPFSREDRAGDFHPRAPEGEVNGSIIDAFDRVNEIGQYDVVVIDRGLADGVVPGTVLQVNNRGETVPDPVARATATTSLHPAFMEKVKLPDEEAGLLMVFRSFERVSFGLIMYARKAIHIHDRVVNP